MAFCGAMLAPSHDAKAFGLGVGDSHELGFLWPGIQRKTDNQNKAIYVNHLIGMAVGADQGFIIYRGVTEYGV